MCVRSLGQKKGGDLRLAEVSAEICVPHDIRIQKMRQLNHLLFEDIWPACIECNREKGDVTTSEYLRYLEIVATQVYRTLLPHP